MSDHKSRHKESLSSLMDGEVDELELHRILKAISEDVELRESWSRYHLARSAVRNELPDKPVDLSAAINLALDDEPEHNVSAGAPAAWQFLGRVAIAASVAVMAVLGVQQYNLSGSELGSGQISVANTGQADNPSLTMPSGFQVPTLVTRNVSSDNGVTIHNQPRPVVLLNQASMDEATRQQLEIYFNTMMSRHTEHSVEEGGNSLLPYARLPREALE